MSPQDNNKTPGREFALKFLFQLFIKENSELRRSFYEATLSVEDLDEEIALFKESYETPDEEHPSNQLDQGNFFFAQKLLKGLTKNIQANEKVLIEELKREHLEGLEKVDRCVLLIGVEELYHYDTPYQVVINEMVELAKRYGGEQSGRFVNGVLDGVRSKKR